LYPVRTTDYKYYCNSEGNELLYDLVNDPYELCDVSNDLSYTHIIADMRKRMILRMHNASFNCNEKEAEY